ncbi:hypothetical protein ABIA32_005503 [Streptacidiphilus sp. MAP12-20]|uniref:hypothetical protein n=1 Tax=Streptacidiphilus sp. MAP12-20 TaxID=3156299 RepID=UPI003513AAE5
MGLFDIPAESLRPDESETGPLSPRSRRGLWWQFWFQWTYLLVGSVLILAVVGLLLWASALGGDVGGLGGGGRGSQIKMTGSAVLTRRQYRLERDGGRDAWAKRVQEALREGTKRADNRRASAAKSRAKAEAKAAAKGRQLGPAIVFPDQLELTVPIHRGAGLGLVEELGAPLGWELDWKRSRASQTHTAYLTRQPTVGPAVA